MKKKFLLGIIPALLALSSCAGLGPKENVKEENLLAEDTLAHEEIFGEAKIEMLGYKNPLRAPSGPVAPYYGVQYQDAGDNVHVRFIAAIWLPNSSVEVEWNRTMFKGHLTGEQYTQSGHVFKGAEDKPCTKAYTSLANGTEEPLTIASINTEIGREDYNCFVVYTMLNIPKSAYSDYSFRAFIKMNDVASTKGIGATVGGTANATFDLDRTGHFISGRFNGVHDEYAPVYDAEHEKGDGNNATYHNIPLKVGDSFALVYFDSVNNVFLLNGTSRFNEGVGDYFTNSKKTPTAKFEGSFTFYLNSSDIIYLGVDNDLVRPIYVDVSERTWWGESSDHYTVLWAFGGTADDEWIVMERIGTSNLYVTPDPIDPADHKQFIIGDSTSNNPSWSTLVNRSKDSTAINGKGASDCLKIWDQDTGDGHDYKWWVSWVTRS